MLCERCHVNEAVTFRDMAHICFECVEILKANHAWWVDSSPTYSAVLAQRDAVAFERAVPRLREQKPWQAQDAVLDTAICTLCAGAESPGFYTGCMIRDGTLADTHWSCDGKGRLTKKRVRPASLNAFAAEVHAANQHWWHDPATGEKLDRNMDEMFMLTVSEIAECMEGERKDLMDDHLPNRKMAEVELADAVIRIGDIAGAKHTDLDALIHKVVGWHFGTLPANKAAALYQIAGDLSNPDITYGWRAAEALWKIVAYARAHNYDLWSAVAEKREYNKHRADHKPAARLAAGGKKF